MIQWSIKNFNQLSNQELLYILIERAQVFVVEQVRHYPDPDKIDLEATHIIGYLDNKIIAYARIFKKDNFVTFGRVLIALDYRNQGLGKALMAQIFSVIDKQFPETTIMIEAQLDKQEYYSQFGFKAIGTAFIFNQTPHIHMQKEPLD